MKAIISESDCLKKKFIVHWNDWNRMNFCCLLKNKKIIIPDPHNAKEHDESFLTKKNESDIENVLKSIYTKI